MTEPPGSAAGDAPAPWWEASPEGAEIPVALVRIERVRSEDEAAERAPNDMLRRRVRFSAGVEYIARAFGAVEPLASEGGGTTLILGGGDAERLPKRAYLAARELWERARIDLDLPVRIGAHVGYVRRSSGMEAFASSDMALCERLAAAAPERALVVSEDVALGLRDEDRRDLAPLGMMRDGMAAWIFPASAASQATGFEESPDQALWSAFRRYALGPDVRVLRYVGFRLQKREPPSLDIRDVFVAPHAAPRDADGHAPAITIRDLFARHRSAVILGDPGSGKTTLLRWLAVSAAGGRFQLGEQLGVSERLLPLLVSVGGLAEVKRGLASDAPVPTALARYFQERGLGDERAIEAFLGPLLEAGRCLVLLDGLDAVLAEDRPDVQAWLASFAARYSGNRFVATSRTVGFIGSPIPDAAEATLQPFDDADVERFVRAFTGAGARRELGDEDAVQRQAEANRLLGSLHRSDRLVAMARSPLLLSILALIHRAGGPLPRRRIEVYERLAQSLCELWADARRMIAPGPDGAYDDEALPILGELAIAMHRRYPAGAAPKAFVVETLTKAFAERRGVPAEEAERTASLFLDRAQREAQILLERGAGEWGFLHLTFQEFFVAAGLLALERFEDEARAHLSDPRWEEVLRFGVGYLSLVQKRPEAARRFVEEILPELLKERLLREPFL